MQVRYCWRCRADVPMLDELEFERWHVAFQRCVKSVKTYRQDHAAGLPDVPMDRLFADARTLYSEMTAAPDTHHNAIWHHRLSLLGPPCARCGKPLRTPQARFCPECWTRREPT